jgi:hypothetical protein
LGCSFAGRHHDIGLWELREVELHDAIAIGKVVAKSAV